MGDEDITPMGVGDENAPFAGPDPDADEAISTHPATDSDIDAQEYYDEGLADAAEMDEEDMDDDDDVHLPDGFHIE